MLFPSWPSSIQTANWNNCWVDFTALWLDPHCLGHKLQPGDVYSKRLFITIIAYQCNGTQESGEESKKSK